MKAVKYESTEKVSIIGQIESHSHQAKLLGVKI